MYRNFKDIKIEHSYYLMGVVAFISFNYYVYAFQYLSCMGELEMILVGLIFHVIFFMLTWSMIRTVISDPGRVPVFWGFIIDDSENKKRRYCLICHIFKPERCHHCSKCCRCVLNMDHHCPWINNCVGYQNRKFFILFLLYINILTVFLLLTEFSQFYQMILNVLIELNILGKPADYNLQYMNMISDNILMKVIQYIMISGFQVVILFFFKFHLELMLTNSTTIDNLEKERLKNLGQDVSNTNQFTQFDIGYMINFKQVFGENYLLWPFPMFGESGKPIGDGVIWAKQTTQSSNIMSINQSQNQQSQIQQQVQQDIQRRSFLNRNTPANQVSGTNMSVQNSQQTIDQNSQQNQN